MENDEEDEETAENTRQHWSQLNVKGMKVGGEWVWSKFPGGGPA